MKREKPISGAITEHRKKTSPSDFFLLLVAFVPPPPSVAVTIEDIYEYDTGEEFLNETEPIKPDKDLGKDSSTRIPNYRRPETAVPDPRLTASAALAASRLKKQKTAE